MAWDLSNRSVAVGPGEFSEVVEVPDGNVVLAGGYTLLDADGDRGKPIANVWESAPNGSGSWRVSGNLDQACLLTLWVTSLEPGELP